MIIQFKKKQLRHYLIFGILWIVLAVFTFVFSESNFLTYSNLLLGILFLGTYVYENRSQYLTIENGIITKNNLLPRKLPLDKITRVKKIAGDIILISDTKEMRIHTELIDENSLVELQTVLDGLNIKY